MNTNKNTVVAAAKTTEYAVLSLLLKHSDNRLLLSDLTKEHFSEPSCIHTFDAIMRLEKSNTKVDVSTVHDKLIQMDIKTVTVPMLENIRLYPSHSDNIETYKEVLEDKKNKRKLSEIAESIKEITLKDLSYEDMITQSLSSLSSMSCNLGEQTLTHADIKKNTIAELISKMGSNEQPLSWGIKALDDATGGIPADMIAFAGMSGGHKTTFAVQVMLANARAGHNTLFFSAEMTAEMLMYREFAKEFGISATRLRTGKITKEELALLQTYETIDNLWINPVSGIDIDKLVSIAKIYHRKHGLKLIVVDYLQLLTTTVYKDNEFAKIKHISSKLKGLSHDLGIPVFVLCQYNKDAANLDKPTAGNIYGSGFIKNDSGLVMMLHREDYFDQTILNNPNHAKHGLVEMIIDKNRYERSNVSVFFKLNHNTQVFHDLPIGYRLPQAPTESAKAAFGKKKAPTPIEKLEDIEVPEFPGEKSGLWNK